MNLHYEHFFYSLGKLLITLCCIVIASCSNLDTGKTLSIVDSSEVRRLLKDAVTAEESGDIGRASELFEQMMSRGARSARSLNRYAVFLRRQFDIEAAEKIYLQALKNEPAHANTHYNLGILYELYRGDLDKAQSHFKKYLAATSDDEQSEQRLVNAWIKDIDRRIAANKKQTGASE